MGRSGGLGTVGKAYNFRKCANLEATLVVM